MFKKGDLVVYVRPHPDEVGLVHRVAGTCLDGFGWWVKLEEEPEDATGGPVEIDPGVYGGCGGWEHAKEFQYANSGSSQ